MGWIGEVHQRVRDWVQARRLSSEIVHANWSCRHVVPPKVDHFRSRPLRSQITQKIEGIV
jgi:hypothetical protein